MQPSRSIAVWLAGRNATGAPEHPMLVDSNALSPGPGKNIASARMLSCDRIYSGTEKASATITMHRTKTVLRQLNMRTDGTCTNTLGKCEMQRSNSRRSANANKKTFSLQFAYALTYTHHEGGKLTTLTVNPGTKKTFQSS